MDNLKEQMQERAQWLGNHDDELISKNNKEWREKIEEIIKIVETQIGEYIYAPIINKDVPDWVLKLELVLVNLQELLSEMGKEGE